MSINWSKRVNSEALPVTDPDLTAVRLLDGSLLGRTVEALLKHKKMLKVHLPIVTRAAAWFLAVTDTPIEEVDAIDRVVVTEDKMGMYLLYVGSSSRRRIEIYFTTVDAECRLAEYAYKTTKSERPLEFEEPKAGKQFIQACNWLEE